MTHSNTLMQYVLNRVGQQFPFMSLEALSLRTSRAGIGNTVIGLMSSFLSLNILDIESIQGGQLREPDVLQTSN